LALSVVALLGGCAAFTSPPAPAPQAEAPTPAAAVEPLPSPPPRKPSPPGPVVARLLPPGSEAEPEPAPAPAPPVDGLIGLDQPHVAVVLGPPASRADAPPATIWRYGAQGCELDLYFYLDLQSQTMRALHYEARSHESSERSAQRCYDALVNERRARLEPAGDSDRSR
jgi:hypothetical protein